MARCWKFDRKRSRQGHPDRCFLSSRLPAGIRGAKRSGYTIPAILLPEGEEAVLALGDSERMVTWFEIEMMSREKPDLAIRKGCSFSRS